MRHSFKKINNDKTSFEEPCLKGLLKVYSIRSVRVTSCRLMGLEYLRKVPRTWNCIAFPGSVIQVLTYWKPLNALSYPHDNSY